MSEDKNNRSFLIYLSISNELNFTRNFYALISFIYSNVVKIGSICRNKNEKKKIKINRKKQQQQQKIEEGIV